MNCSICSREVEVTPPQDTPYSTRRGFFYSPVNKDLYHEKFWIPFYCPECGAIKFPWRAIRDIAFLYPIPVRDTFEETGQVVIPENYKEFYKKGEGVLLSIGPGYQDDKKFNPSSEQLQVGLLVQYNVEVMWSIAVEGNDGKEHAVTICGAQDIWFTKEACNVNRSDR